MLYFYLLAAKTTEHALLLSRVSLLEPAVASLEQKAVAAAATSARLLEEMSTLTTSTLPAVMQKLSTLEMSVSSHERYARVAHMHADVA